LLDGYFTPTRLGLLGFVVVIPVAIHTLGGKTLRNVNGLDVKYKKSESLICPILLMLADLNLNA
jgi:hypothetical protein